MKQITTLLMALILLTTMVSYAQDSEGTIIYDDNYDVFAQADEPIDDDELLTPRGVPMQRMDRMGPHGKGRGLKSGRGGKGFNFDDFWGHRYTEEDYKKIIELIEEDNSEVASYIKTVKAKNPDKCRRPLGRFMKLLRLKDRDPKKYEDAKSVAITELEIWMLSDKYMNSTSDSERKNLAEEIKSKVSNQFDKREELKLKVIDELKKKIKHHKELYDYRMNHKEEIVEKRVAQLLGRDDKLKW